MSEHGYYRPPTGEEAETAVRLWNESWPIGMPVHFQPVKDDPRREETRTRSEAWVMGGHSAMVMVEGRTGGVALSHITVRNEKPEGSVQ